MIVDGVLHREHCSPYYITGPMGKPILMLALLIVFSD